MTRRRLFPLLLALLLVPALAQEAPKSKTVRLLTIGNSFSQNAVRYLAPLAQAAGHKLVLRQCDIGGSTLAQHWDKAQLHTKDPADKQGLYANGRSLDESLKAGPLDFVTIQQASIRSHDVTGYRPYAANLQAFVKERAPGATLLLHETWEYRVDDPRFAVKSPKAGEPATQQAMYDGLEAAYSTIAKELGVRLLPVGDAFHAVNHDPLWGFKPDPAFNAKTAKEPALPDQSHSLNVGYKWAKQKDDTVKLTMDGHHASDAGCYLAGCVWFEVLFGESVVGNTFVPKGLPADWAARLRQAAHDAVARRATP